MTPTPSDFRFLFRPITHSPPPPSQVSPGSNTSGTYHARCFDSLAFVPTDSSSIFQNTKGDKFRCQAARGPPAKPASKLLVVADNDKAGAFAGCYVYFGQHSTRPAYWREDKKYCIRFCPRIGTWVLSNKMDESLCYFAKSESWESWEPADTPPWQSRGYKMHIERMENKQAEASVETALKKQRAVGVTSAGMDARTIEAKLKSSKTKFIDASFPPKLTSIVGQARKNETQSTSRARESIGDPRALMWRRPEEFYGSGTNAVAVFRRGAGDARPIEPNDICQGQLGNCWFCCALANLAENPSWIMRVVKTHGVSTSGAYDVRLCLAGKWITVTIDDYFPCKRYGQPVFLTSRDRELWVMLIEKAFAKSCGSYFALRSGQTHTAYEDLTGCPSENITLAQYKSKDGLWALIQKCAKLQCPLACGTFTQAEYDKMGWSEEKLTSQTGLRGEHAYSILDAKEYKGTRLVQIRNPWGHGEWRGAWSDNDKARWTDERVRAFGATFGDDGVFFMEFKDVFSFFNNLYLCYTHSSNGKRFTETRAARSFSAADRTACYRFTVKSRTEVMAGLHQRDRRDPRAPEYVDMHIYVVNETSGAVSAWSCGKKRSVHARGTLEPGRHLLIAHTSGVCMKASGLKNAEIGISLHSEIQLQLPSSPSMGGEPARAARKNAVLSLLRSKGKSSNTGPCKVRSVSLGSGWYFGVEAKEAIDLTLAYKLTGCATSAPGGRLSFSKKLKPGQLVYLTDVVQLPGPKSFSYSYSMTFRKRR